MARFLHRRLPPMLVIPGLLATWQVAEGGSLEEE